MPLLYKYVIRGCYLDLGFVVMSPHVLASAVQFVITFFTGFWLNRNVTFSLSPLSSRRRFSVTYCRRAVRFCSITCC